MVQGQKAPLYVEEKIGWLMGHGIGIMDGRQSLAEQGYITPKKITHVICVMIMEKLHLEAH